MDKKRAKQAVSETLGTIMLLGIAIALFSVVSLIVLTFPFNPSTPTVSLIGMIDGNDIIIEHRGGEPLGLDTQILITISDQRLLIDGEIPTVEDLLNDEAKEDNKWGIGEILYYSVGNVVGGTHVDPISHYEVSTSPLTLTASDDPLEKITVAVVDRPSNSVVMMGNLQESGMSAALDSVELWYWWSEEFWSDIFDNDDLYVSSYNYMDFSGGDFVTVTPSGGAIDDEDFVDNDISDVDGSFDKGSHSDFDNEKAKDDVDDILMEEDVSETTKDFVDSDSSDIDSSPDKGSHSNFPAQQAGPDGIIDILTEENTDIGTVTTILLDDGFEGSGSSWDDNWDQTSSNWEQSSYSPHGGSYIARSDSDNDGVFDCDDLDASGASSITVDFWYRKINIESTEFSLYYYNGFNWGSVIFELDSGGSDWSWLHYTDVITDSQYFVSDFRIRFDATLGDYGYAYVDDVLITKEVDHFNYELDLELQWTDINPGLTNELAIYYEEALNTHSLEATGGYMRIGDGNVDWGSSAGTISFWIKWDSFGDRPWGQHELMEIRTAGSKLRLDWGSNNALTSNTDFIDDKWYFIAITWDENDLANDLDLYVGDKDNIPTLDSHVDWNGLVTARNPSGTGNTFMASRGNNPVDGHGDDLRYYDTARSLVDIQSDYNTELSGSETNLRSYFKLNNNLDVIGPENNEGSGSGSYSFSFEVPFGYPSTENLKVDYWDGSIWQPIFSSLTPGWNNASITSWPTGTIFTIRYKGASESSDATQDSWCIDASLIAISYSSNYELDLEVQWTGITNYDLINEELCIYTNTLGSENLIVDVWDGSNWQEVINPLSSGWNNASVNSWLTSSTFTIRYRDQNQGGDSTQDSWEIDAVLLHLWRPDAVYYQGNITSISITKTSTYNWDKFYADVDNPDSTFSILDGSNNVLLSGLEGNGDDISSITSDTIRLFGSFDSLNPVKLDSWKVTIFTTGFVKWSDPENPDTISPWSWEFDFPENEGYYKFYSIGKKSGYPDELPPTTPDAECEKI